MEIKVIAPKLTTYQKRILESPARFTITEAATKCGKTFSHIYWLFKEAHLGKDGSNYWWVAPVYSQAEIAFTRMKRIVAKNSLYLINYSKLTITTPLGTIIQFKSAEKPDNLYGEDVYAAVFDEFTRARHEAWIALRSTLTATKGKCKLIGNAKGKKNWGYLLGMKARAGEPNYEYFRITSYDAAAEGIISYEEIEQAKRDLPDLAFRELYLAEPNEDAANPFGITAINNCIKPCTDSVAVCFGVDLAKYHDFTVITGLNKSGDVCYFERFQSDWDITKKKIIQVVGKKPCLIDSTGVGDPIVEDLQKFSNNFEGYKFTSESKQKLMEGLALSIQTNKISFNDETLIDELKAYEFIYSMRGVKYSAPNGVNDDCVCSLALANHKFADNLLHIKRKPSMSFKHKIDY